MRRELSVLQCVSEAAPFAKTGGLADVCGALPAALARQGHDVRMVLPYYRSVRQSGVTATRLEQVLSVAVAGRVLTCPVWRAALGGAAVYFIEQPSYFDREHLYGVGAEDYADNLERFACLSNAAVALCRLLGWEPDIVHCHDWQTGLAAAYVAQLRQRQGTLRRTGVLMTIHNVGYQGLFPKSQFPITGLGEEAFTPEGVEFHGKVNLLKAGIVYADGISTVSPTYAREIQTATLGAGLDGVVRDRRDCCWGILNGVDDDVWNPERDPLIPQRYDPEDLDGKAVCKARLQEEMRLPVRAEVPLIGMITRLADQKGIDLVAQAMDHLMRLEVQLVILGSGDRSYETLLGEVAARHPGRLALVVKYDNALAHRIEAGADMFLMPSRYEPCGLNQMYSLKYGTVPIVRRTGGLADTVVDATPSATAAGTATGVVFEPYTAVALVEAVERALARYADRTAWRRLMLNGMRQDFSWDRAAQQYVRIYRLLHEQRLQHT